MSICPAPGPPAACRLTSTPLAAPHSMVVIFLVAVLVVGCQLTPGPQQPSSTTDRYGGTLTIRFAEAPSIVNPLREDELNQLLAPLLFPGLMRLDSQLRPVPNLAESWSVSPDELVWTFKLRPGLRWHDGTTLTAEDVLFTYRLLLESAVGEGLTTAVVQADLQQAVDNIDAPDPYTVRVTLRRRFAPLLADLAVPVLPRHLLREKPTDSVFREPISVGSGPFRLASQEAAAITLDAVPQHLLGRPYLDRLVFRWIPDEAEAEREIRSRQILLARISAATAATLVTDQESQLLAYPELTFYYVGFNLRPGHLFSDKALRQAWALSVDRPSLVRDALDGRGEPVDRDVPSYSWAFDERLTPAARDIAKAGQLLSAAGWQQVGDDGVRVREGQRLSTRLMVREDAPERVKSAQLMSRQLREVGIEVQVLPVDFAGAMSFARRPPFDFDALLMGWTVGVDPDNYYLFHSSQVPTAEYAARQNFVGFSNKEYDRLSVEARATTAWSRREQLYHEIQRLVADEQPYAFLWADRIHILASERLSGLPAPASPSLWSTIPRWSFRPN